MDFDRLANQHKDAVYRQMLRVCGNREDAEDVLIEALLRAYRGLDHLRDAEAFRGWLAQIARRVCWRLKNRHSLQPLLQLSMLEQEGQQIAAVAPPPDASIDAARTRQALHDAVDALPAIYRDVFEMRDIEERSGEETAVKLGISLAAQKSRLHRARQLLRRTLDTALTV